MDFVQSLESLLPSTAPVLRSPITIQSTLIHSQTSSVSFESTYTFKGTAACDSLLSCETAEEGWGGTVCLSDAGQAAGVYWGWTVCRRLGRKSDSVMTI